jgi:RNA polymerase sigma-70 factor (ECF subfamily)
VRPGEDDRPADGERHIVGRIAAGDEQAFAMAYDQYADLLFGSVVRFSGDREVAAEVVQDTFLALWHKARQFDARSGSLRGWLLGIARNRAIDRHRAAARRPLASALPLAGPNDSTAADSTAPEPADRDDQADPVALVERRWLQSVIRTFVSELPDDERDVLVMAYSAGLSQSEISGRTGLPLGTVKSRTRRAMAHLRSRLANVPGVGVDAGEIVEASRGAR